MEKIKEIKPATFSFLFKYHGLPWMFLLNSCNLAELRNPWLFSFVILRFSDTQQSEKKKQKREVILTK